MPENQTRLIPSMSGCKCSPSRLRLRQTRDTLLRWRQFHKCRDRASMPGLWERSLRFRSVCFVRQKILETQTFVRRVTSQDSSLEPLFFEGRYLIAAKYQSIASHSTDYHVSLILRNVHTMPRGTQRQSAARLRGKSCAMPLVYVDITSAWLWHAIRCCAT